MNTKRKWFIRIAVVYLLGVGFFVWGLSFGRYNTFPWQVIGKPLTQLENFVKGDPFDKTSLWDRFWAELSGDSVQFEAKTSLAPVKGKALDKSFFSPKQTELPVLKTSLSKGYYLIYGMFAGKDDKLSPYAILIDTKGKVVKNWSIPFIGPSKSIRRLLLTKEGYLITNNSDALRCYTWDGKLKWEHVRANFHHEIEDHRQKVYLWQKNSIVVVNKQDGAFKPVLSLRDIVLNNPQYSVMRSGLGMFKYPGQERKAAKTKKNQKLPFKSRDPFHPNAVVINDNITSHFPGGSFLLSFRNIDSVMVVDPKTAKILWLEKFDRQHSPRWGKDGITVYNNRTHFRYSRIEYVAFNGERKIVVDGKDYNFYRSLTGNHRFLKNGDLMFMANGPEFYHLDSKGKVLTRFINRYNKKKIKLRNAYYVSEEQFARFENLNKN